MKAQDTSSRSSMIFPGGWSASLSLWPTSRPFLTGQSLFFQFYWDLVLALPKPLELSESAALSTTLSPGKLHRDMEEWVKPMCENLPEAGFSLIYFSWKSLNICYARGRNKEHGIARVRTGWDLLQGLSTLPGEAQLLGGVCWEMTPAEPRLCSPSSQQDCQTLTLRRGALGLAGAELTGH